MLSVQYDKRAQALGIGRNMARIDTFTDQLLTDEAPHMFVADTRDQGGFQAKAGTADADIGGAATNIFGETGHVLETPANCPP